MKKIKTAAAAVIISAAALGIAASAESQVYVTISDGKNVLAESVSVKDTDGDGAITVNDALYCAHEQFYSGGAEGFGAEQTEYGLSMTKLWGIENGGAYGYYVNNVSAFSLTDPVSGGDCVSAFVYTDTAGFSDMYCFFDKNNISAASGEKISLTLSGAAYDENWNPVTVPVSGAEILVNGEKTGIKTDENGKAEISLSSAGTAVISAVSDSAVLVPPVCKAVVSGSDPAPVAANPPTGAALTFIAPAISAIAAFAFRKRNG